MVRGVQREVARVVTVFVACAAIAVGVAACGGSHDPAGGAGRVVVSFEGHVLTAGVVAHWDAVEGILSRDLYPQAPQPAGFTLVAPRFAACVAYERAHPAIGAAGKPAAPAVLREQCRARYEEVHTHMLQLLIGYEWMEAETRAHGIHISERELQTAYKANEHVEFHTRLEWSRYLKYSGLSPVDERKLVRFDVELGALREKILRERGPSGARAFYTQYPRELAARTSCSPGYVIAECKQYQGPEEPIS